ncbi:MAG: histidine kinase [Candidatus Competibacteraceae bacterium]|nr:histidine kinase [Candidatus Competibacteraceae bacterium]MCB1813344.1 histidine kinase [Candidatus Competibacteraceae bacterium]
MKYKDWSLFKLFNKTNTWISLRLGATSQNHTNFIPNLCSARNTFLSIILVQLLALILAISATVQPDFFWPKLSLISLFSQWILLCSIASICCIRNWLNKTNIFLATITIYILTQFISIGLSAFSIWLNHDNLILLSPNTDFNAQFLIQVWAISSIIVLLTLRYFYVHYQWQSSIIEQEKTHLKALQARIQPHFLFNSLNTIASLTRSNPQEAENAVLDLADLFRKILKEEEITTIAEELELARGYIHLESHRLKNSLVVKWQIANTVPMHHSIPCLILQPLLENAIRHGIERTIGGGVISIHISQENNFLCIVVRNPIGYGVDYPGSGIALDNIEKRLKLIYGELGMLKVQRKERIFQVEIRLPLTSIQLQTYQ